MLVQWELRTGVGSHIAGGCRGVDGQGQQGGAVLKGWIREEGCCVSTSAACGSAGAVCVITTGSSGKSVL